LKKLVLFFNHFRNASERQSISKDTEVIYLLLDEQTVLSENPGYESRPSRTSLASLIEVLQKDITEKNIRIFVVLPSSDILFTELTIPGKQFRQVQKVLPYLVEDQIASDPEDCFIAIGTKFGDQVPTAIIKRDIMGEWIDLFSRLGIYAEKMVADISLLDAQGNMHRLDIVDDYAMLHLTTGKYYGFQLALLPVYLKKLVPMNQIKKAEQTNQIQIHSHEEELLDLIEGNSSAEFATLNVTFYSSLALDTEVVSDDLEESSTQNNQKQHVEILLQDIKKDHALNINSFFSFKSASALYLEMAAKISSRNHEPKAINLLQGEFKTRRTAGAFKLDIHWKPTAALILALFVMYLSFLVIEISKYQSASKQAESEIQRIFKEIFPNTTNFTSMRTRVATLLKQGGNAEGVQFLTIFYSFSEAMQAINNTDAGALKPTQIQFDDNGELKVDIIAASFDHLNALKQKAEQGNLLLEIASTNTEKGGVKGRLRIRMK